MQMTYPPNTKQKATTIRKCWVNKSNMAWTHNVRITIYASKSRSHVPRTVWHVDLTFATTIHLSISVGFKKIVCSMLSLSPESNVRFYLMW